MTLPQIVFIDGIGGRRSMRKPLFSYFAQRGHACHHFDYRPSRESLAEIQARLALRLQTIAADGPYLLIGYSCGGVLARAVLTTRADVPAPQRLVLIASPMRAMTMCRRFRNWPIFRWLTGECGQLLASDEAMASVGRPAVLTTCIYGTRGYSGPFALAGRQPNDGMVCVAEVAPELFDDALAMRASHPFIATNPTVIEAIAKRVSSSDLRQPLTSP